MFYLDDKEFGRIYITIRRNSHRISARWKNSHICVNIPHGVSKAELETFIDQHRDKIKRLNRSNVEYAIGQIIRCFRCNIVIGEQNRFRNKIIFGHEDDDLYLNLPKGIDLTDELVKKGISSAMQAIMHDEAVKRLIPHAIEVAGRLNVHPGGFEIGRGLKKLGHCTPKGIIQLSRNVMFLPEELVDLIICHELAHLTHFNHSAAFHALVNQYLEGRERELEAKLKKHQWPILR